MRCLLLVLAALWLRASSPDGAGLYRQHCASCHTRPAAPRVPNDAALRNLSTRRIVQSLDTGIMMMPGRRVTPEGRRAIAEFLTGKRLSEEPPPARTATCSDRPVLRPAAPQWTGWSPGPNNSRYQPN